MWLHLTCLCSPVTQSWTNVQLQAILASFHLVYKLSVTFLYLFFEMSKVVQPLTITPLVCSYGSIHIIHCSCDRSHSTAHYHSLLLLCWESVLYYIHCHLMLIMSSQYSLCHTLWVCTRSWSAFYFQYHYGILARWPCSWGEYQRCQCNQTDHAWRVFLRQHGNSCSQWVSWFQLHKILIW